MRGFGVLAAALLMAACSSGAPEKQPEPPPPPRDLLLEVRTAGLGDDALEVQPLRDPAVADLRETARQREAARDFAGADAALAQALALAPGDPELMQWRAELALVRGRGDAAVALANESWERGPRLGPLCRRNWATVMIVRELAGDAAGRQAAAAQMEKCTVAPPVRM